MIGETQIESIINTIKANPESAQIAAWNKFCSERNRTDENICTYAKMLDAMRGDSPDGIIMHCQYGSINPNDNYAEINGCGYWHTFNALDESQWYDCEELARYLSEEGDGNIGTEEFVDRRNLLSDFAHAYGIADEIGDVEDFINDMDYDLLTDDWDVIFPEYELAYDV